MSTLELHGLLVDASQNGAYFVEADGRDALVAAASALDFALAQIDRAGCEDLDLVLQRFARALRFPDWFGDNWDALADCLGDLSWWPADGYLLLIEHAQDWRMADPIAFATLLEILNDAAGQWGGQQVPFWALIPLSAEALAAID